MEETHIFISSAVVNIQHTSLHHSADANDMRQQVQHDCIENAVYTIAPRIHALTYGQDRMCSPRTGD